MLANTDTSTTTATTKAQVSLSDGDSELHSKTSMWKSKNTNKRRFSDQQIRSLESMFVYESRPELQIKQQLANDLGLHPRQVAIWFQNKRARSKSQLIEQEYGMLKSSYDTLASKVDSLKKENQCLLIQLKRLRNLMGKPEASRNHGMGQTQKSIDEQYDNTDANTEAKENNLLYDCINNENRITMCDDSSKNVENFVEEPDILNVEMVPDGSVTSYGNWYSFESSFASSCVLEDHPSCSSPWWEL